MSEEPDNANLSGLRKRAEEALRRSDLDVEQVPLRELQTLVHDLQVHQVELRMQNEELRATQLQLEASRDNYTELYEFAPVGYLTLNSNAVIQTANLTATRLFGLDRSGLIHSKLAKHIAPQDQDTFHRGMPGA